MRRGPTDHVQLVAWDTDTDEFTAGQWFKGRIHEDRCDLSPDGRYFVYFAAKHRWVHVEDVKETWTAISRPPYFTALAIWFFGGTWHGGGVFESASPTALAGL